MGKELTEEMGYSLDKPFSDSAYFLRTIAAYARSSECDTQLLGRAGITVKDDRIFVKSNGRVSPSDWDTIHLSSKGCPPSDRGAEIKKDFPIGKKFFDSKRGKDEAWKKELTEEMGYSLD